MNKAEIQEKQYSFPYHYIPRLLPDGSASRTRHLRWGFEYLCCMLHIKSCIDELNPSSMLDVGCGDGYLLSLLKDSQSINLCGTDMSRSALAMAEALNPGVSFVGAEVTAMNQKFALVTANEVLEHVDDNEVDTFIDSLIEATVPGGHLLISVPTVNKKLSPKHFRHYTEELLLEQMRIDKRSLVYEGCDHIFDGSDLVYRTYLHLCSNRFWHVSINFFEKLIWKRVMGRMRLTTPEKAHHLVLKLRKLTEP